jgi:hypothetical protein
VLVGVYPAPFISVIQPSLTQIMNVAVALIH